MVLVVALASGANEEYVPRVELLLAEGLTIGACVMLYPFFMYTFQVRSGRVLGRGSGGGPEGVQKGSGGGPEGVQRGSRRGQEGSREGPKSALS
eukprot:929660-Prorocentrum_minimum.AAC.4